MLKCKEQANAIPSLLVLTRQWVFSSRCFVFDIYNNVISNLFFFRRFRLNTDQRPLLADYAARVNMSKSKRHIIVQRKRILSLTPEKGGCDLPFKA